MTWMDWMNQRAKRYTVVDIKLLQWASIFVGLIVVKLVPQIMRASIWVFAALGLLCAIRPVVVFFGAERAARE